MSKANFKRVFKDSNKHTKDTMNLLMFANVASYKTESHTQRTHNAREN